VVASLRGGEMTIKIQRLDLGARGKPGTLTIYTEHRVTYHSIRNISEIINYRLNQCIICFLCELSN